MINKSIETLFNITTTLMKTGGRRMAVGTVAGGTVGYATSDNNTPTGQFKDTLMGAAMGLGIGTLSTKTVLRNSWSLAKNSRGYVAEGITHGVSLGMRAGAGAARFALNNPGTAVGLGALGLGTVALANSGYSSNSAGIDEANAYAQQTEMQSTGQVSNVESRSALIGSTYGLTQGLHRGRHR
jgi:hypothetical protein